MSDLLQAITAISAALLWCLIAAALFVPGAAETLGRYLIAHGAAKRAARQSYRETFEAMRPARRDA